MHTYLDANKEIIIDFFCTCIFYTIYYRRSSTKNEINSTPAHLPTYYQNDLLHANVFVRFYSTVFFESVSFFNQTTGRCIGI